MVLELILYRFFSLLNNFFFSTSFLLKINHPIINHFSIVSILPQRSAQALLPYSFPFNSFIGKRNHPFERDYRTSTTNDAKIERARSKQAITRDPRFSWRCRNTLQNVINLLRVRSSVRFLTIQWLNATNSPNRDTLFIEKEAAASIAHAGHLRFRGVQQR